MATVTFDAELMTQQVAAVAIPNSHVFSTAWDEEGGLMIFSLGSNGVFYVFKQDANGARVMIDLGAALGIDSSTITAFDVAQNPTNSTLYLAVAYTVQSVEGSLGASQTKLAVLKPFTPSMIDVTSPSLDLSNLIIPMTGTGVTSISGIYLGDDTSGSGYPQLILSYVPLDRVHQSTDLGRVQVDPTWASWQLLSDLSLPENASSIVAICPAVLPIGVGYFTLYEIQSQTQLVFSTTGAQFPFQVALQCPQGASSLATFVDSTNHTALLVGGDSLYYWSAQDCQVPNKPGTVLSSDPVFTGVTEVLVSQSEQDLSIFAANTSLGIGYALASAANPTTGLVAAPLVPDGQGGVFAPLLSPDGLSLHLIVADASGNLNMLMQDTATGLWSYTPFYTPSLTQNVDFQSYTLHIELQDANNTPMTNQNVLLTSSGWVDVTANGRAVKIGPSGTPLSTDSDGILTLLIPTEDISSYCFTLGNVLGSPTIFNSPITIDPTYKVNNMLAAIQHASDLQNATLQTGGHLLDGSTLPPEQIEQAAQAINTLHGLRTIVPADGSRLQRSRRERRLEFDPGSIRAGKSLGRLICGQNIDNIRQADSIIDMAWDAWEWLVSQGAAFVSWAVEQGTKGLLFVVQIGDQFLRWAVDGLTEIGKAISWVFDKVLEIANKIIDWLGFLLNWGDIQKTHLSLVAVVNGGLQAGADNLATMAQQVDTFFQNLEETIRTALYPDELTGQVANSSSDQGPVLNPQKANQSSVKGNWAKYQFSHGGALAASSIPGSESSDPFYQAWVTLIEPAFASLQTTMETLSDDIVSLFKGDGDSIGLGSILQKLGVDVLLGLVDAIRAVVVGLVNMGALILEDFKTFINYEINIPIFSALYKTFISGGTDLTVLDGLAMLLAIPMTIFSKLMTGSTLPDMTTLNYDNLVNGNITDPTQLLNINIFMNFAAWNTKSLKGVVDAASALLSHAAIRDGSEPTLRRQHHLTHLLERQHRLRTALNNPIKMDWRLALSVGGSATSIPTDPSQPGYPIRWVSWLIGCANGLISAVIRKLEAAEVPDPVRKRAFAVIEAVNALINFALVCAVNGLEFTTPSFPGKDDAITTLNCFGSVFDLLSTLGTDGAVVATDPVTKGACEAVGLAGSVFSMNITGGVVAYKAAQGKYNWILTKM